LSQGSASSRPPGGVKEKGRSCRPFHAPREIRTPTVQTDHRALNLAHSLPGCSYGCRIALAFRTLDDPDVLDGAFVVTVLSRRE